MKTFWIAVIDISTKKKARRRVEGRPLKFKETPVIELPLHPNEVFDE